LSLGFQVLYAGPAAPLSCNALAKVTALRC